MHSIKAPISVALMAILVACKPAPSETSTHDQASEQQQVAQQSGVASDQEAQHMHTNMQHMQELMSKIRATKDPSERQALMAEHSAAMRSQMQMMHGQMGKDSCPMMDGGQPMARGEMMGDDQKGAAGAPSEHSCAMMTNMQMMHSMMEQMLDHMMTEQGGKPAAGK